MDSKITIILILFAFCVFMVEESSAQNNTIKGQGDVSARKKNGGYVDLDLFLKAYCKNARGVYERCIRCVAVACVRELDHPRQLRKYQDCIDNHNRCCGREGLHLGNVITGLECYGTGTYDSVITGELATIEAVLGSQKSLKHLRLQSKRRVD